MNMPVGMRPQGVERFPEHQPEMCAAFFHPVENP
jgi:hypothetical protein